MTEQDPMRRYEESLYERFDDVPDDWDLWDSPNTIRTQIGWRAPTQAEIDQMNGMSIIRPPEPKEPGEQTP